MEKRVARFKKELPALANLIKKCEEAGSKQGYLHAIDGRWGRIRRSGGKILVHTVLNILLQMTGSLSMKYGMCLAENKMIAEKVALDSNGWPAFVVNMHDEVQMEVPESEVLDMHYTLDYSLEGDETEKKAIKRVWGSEEKRVLIEQGKMWSAPSLVSASDGIISVTRQYHRAGHILAETMTEAGKLLKLRTPLAGEYKIGSSWADTH